MDDSPLRRVLYVEDEPHIRELVEMSLTLGERLEVRTCDGGPCALQMPPIFMPDLVLLDAMMPDMDGPALLSHMRLDPALAHIPVIFMTAKAMPAEIERFLQMGAIGVIPKPFQPRTLEQEIISIWRKAQRPAYENEMELTTRATP